MSDFLLELRSEEIPARMQAKAAFDLDRLFKDELAKWGVPLGGGGVETKAYHTPRRIALIAKGVPDSTEAVNEEIKGPRISAPDQAVEGFLRKTGLRRDELVERDGVWFGIVNEPGRAMTDVLAEAIPAIIRAFPWPKSMRWGAASLSTESLRWVRPLQGIVALLDGLPVPCEVAGIASGRETMGHRFMSQGPISIDSAATYVEQLRDGHVIVDQDERANIIAVGAKMAARKAGLTLIEDAGLLAENAGLTEWPVPLLGRFDEAYLSVPPEVIQLTARVNQKYFVCTDAEGKLANAFICTANIDAEDGGARIVEGNRKVLAARLSDARFFYETDLKVPLEEQAKKLDRIVFHEKLGTVADKVERVAKLARWLVEEDIIKPLPFRSSGAVPSPGRDHGRPNWVGVGSVSLTETVVHGDSPHPNPSPEGEGLSKQQSATPTNTPPFVSSEVEKQAASDPTRVSTSLDTNGSGVSLADLAERAARLCKADLVTGMVGEFPELQGLMGGYYAAAQGEDPRVAAAIRDHYKPVGQGDDVPTDPVTVAVSLADKLDTFVSFFGVNELPTGSKDPFALRRASLGLIALILETGARVRISDLWGAYWKIYIKICAERDLIPIRLQQTFDETDRLMVSPHYIESLEDYEGPFDQEIYVVGNQALLDRDILPLDEALSLANWRLLDPMVFPENLIDFLSDRLKVQQREAGVRHDLIDAVFALGGEDDLVRLLARVRALQAFIGTEDGANLLAGYKRAANILKKEGGVPAPSPHRGEGRGEGAPQAASLGAPPHPTSSGTTVPRTVEDRPGDDPTRNSPEGERALGYTPEPAEAALIAALDIAAPAAAAAVAAEDFEAAMAALATLRAPIDAFFESVTVNDPDPAKRTARLSLLEKVRDAVLRVADFSEIVG